MRKNMVEPDRTRMTIQHGACTACPITKAIDAYS